MKEGQTMVDTDDRSHDIEAIVLPKERHDAPSAGGAGWWSSGDSAQINAGALIAFDASLSRQAEEDISNSLLFAQLAADAQADRFAEEPTWSKTYKTVLATVGWNLQQFDVVSPVRITPPVDWAEVVAKAYSALSGAAMAAKAMRAAAALPAGSEALMIWETSAAEAVQGNFIVQTCRAENSDLLGDSAQVIYTLIHEPDGFLNWATYYEVATRSTRMELNEDVYKLVRQVIIDKLGDRPKYYVVPVPL